MIMGGKVSSLQLLGKISSPVRTWSIWKLKLNRGTCTDCEPNPNSCSKSRAQPPGDKQNTAFWSVLLHQAKLLGTCFFFAVPSHRHPTLWQSKRPLLNWQNSWLEKIYPRTHCNQSQLTGLFGWDFEKSNNRLFKLKIHHFVKVPWLNLKDPQKTKQNLHILYFNHSTSQPSIHSWYAIVK